MLIKNSKNTHPIVLIFSLLLLTLSLILPYTANSALPVTIGDIDNNGLVNLEDTIIALQVCTGINPSDENATNISARQE
ncbi:MAG: hypothetical protein PF495_09370 [Spirochaetales bacterium]|nr:hypothetical protein [Spirochaetales bacterium]